MLARYMPVVYLSVSLSVTSRCSIETAERTELIFGTEASLGLFHNLLLRSYIYHCVWSVITAHNFTPEKRDNNYSPRSLTPTSCLRNNIQFITGILPCCGCL